MKKILVVLPIFLILIVSITIYLAKEENIEYTVLSKKELPVSILKEKQDGNFNIFYDDKYTYVSYKADHKLNEYITTEVTLG